jgi:mono/diheme cytochrome c family protein
VVSNDPLNPQKSLQLTAKVENFHRTAGDGFVPEKIFAPGCVDCHSGRAKDKQGTELYSAVCAVCHRAGGTAVALDSTYMLKAKAEDVRRIISLGSKKMLGFAAAHGGPLTAKQIDSLLIFLKTPSAGTGGAPPKAAPGHF